MASEGNGITFKEQIQARLDFPHHQRALLEESGISPQVVLDRCYCAVNTKAELERLGFSKTQQLIPALLIPMYSPAGELVTHQIKSDCPRKRDGKVVKYETPAGTKVCLDVHPSQVGRVKDPSIPLWITEGVKKGDCLVSHGQCAVVLQGVECWKRDGVPLPDWEEIKLYGRQVIVAFDSDVMTNAKVQRALKGLVSFLRTRGATVQVLYLPDTKGGQKQGIDDYLASGETIEAVVQYIEDELREDLGEVGKSLADVKPERVEWLWPRRIPKGKITVLDGDPDNGKSAFTTDVCARVTVGNPMPDGTPIDAAGAVILSAEDGEADTIRPRFDAAGGDPSKVVLLGTILEGNDEERPFVIPDDLPTLERAIRQVGASIVVIDPFMAFLSGRLNANRDQDVRRALTAVKGVAERTGAAIVIVRHLNKDTGTSPLYRGGGSIGIIGAARSGLLVGRHPQEASLRVLAGQKNNLSLPPESLVYGMETADNGAARIVYKGKTQTTARELLEPPAEVGQGTALEEAKGFIREALEGGRKMAAKQMFEDAKAAGIAEATLKRAKRELGVKSKRVGEEWVWYLPEPKGIEGDHDGENDPLDTVDPLDPLGQADVLDLLEPAGSGEEDQEDQEDQESLVGTGDLLESNHDSSAEDGLLARAIMLRDEGRVS